MIHNFKNNGCLLDVSVPALTLLTIALVGFVSGADVNSAIVGKTDVLTLIYSLNTAINE